MQGDGNLVEYAPGNRAVWAGGTGRAGSVVRLQDDGNLVIIAPGNVPVWSTGTDGNLVVYASGHVARRSSRSGSLGDRIGAIVSGERGDSGETGRPAGRTATSTPAVSAPAVRAATAGGRPGRGVPTSAAGGRAGARTDGLSGLARSFTSAGYVPGARLGGVRPREAIRYRLGGDDWQTTSAPSSWSAPRR